MTIPVLAFDLETVPTAAALALPYPEDTRHPPKSYKKAESIAEWRRADRDDWEAERIKQYSLSPLYGRVVAIGYATEDTTTDDIAPSEHDEARLLHDFWNDVAAADCVVTWNGHGFDVPFVLTRSAILGVRVPAIPLLKRYSHYPHCDVKMLATNWAPARSLTSLGDYALAFGLGDKLAHGSDVYAMAQRGEYDAIGQYAAQDAALTLALYHKLAPVFLG